MNRDDIIKMAREAGAMVCLKSPDRTDVEYQMSPESVERFAELVRKDYSFTHAQMWLKRFDDAIKAEREACAKVCEEYETNNDIAETWLNIVSEVIRARGQK
jgi:hypothetical protein